MYNKLRFYVGLGLSLLLSVYCALANAESLPLVSEKGVAPIVIDSEDAAVVNIAAGMLADDVALVSGKRPQINRWSKELQVSDAPWVILAGTLGQSRVVDSLVEKGLLDTSKLKGAWERFSINLIDKPMEGVAKAVVITGSDRRGTAYGLLSLSRKIGVSPWVWWADVTPKTQYPLYIDLENHISKSPSVKYRGVFLNDEDWGLQKWAAKTFEPEVGDMGPKTYGKIFDLLLRLRANAIWPAMHSSTKPFYLIPGNMEAADNYGIVVGTSHAEPMLSNINGEWDDETMGEYRYDTNAEVIKGVFRKRLRQAGQFENLYTVGMRGKHDSPMIMGQDNTRKQVSLLQKVIGDQRTLIEQETGKEASQVPQVFIPYKEVLTSYENGLKLNDDISLMWTDDNYGYIRRLSDPKEQQRAGGAGVYYHTSYWGRPHDYLWLNSTSPALMAEEMTKAWSLNARRIWILNVGDIKPHEYNMELFLDMAWDMDALGNNAAVEKYMNAWVAQNLGEDQVSKVTKILRQYNQLVYQRRPEFMAWSQVEPVTQPGETTLTQTHYGDEVERMIKAWLSLERKAEAGLKALQKDKRRHDAYFELVYYPVVGAANLSLKWLYHFKNQHASRQGREKARWYGKQAVAAAKRIQQETEYYNQTLAKGKWQGMMYASPRHLPVFAMPGASLPNSTVPGIGVALEGYQMTLNGRIENSHADVLPVFNRYTRNRHFIDLYNNSPKARDWRLAPAADWIKLSQSKGTLTPEEPRMRVWVDIDWDLVPPGSPDREPPLGHDFQLIPPAYKSNSRITLLEGDSERYIGVSAFNPKLTELKGFEGFVEDMGYVSINAENYQRSRQGKKANWQTQTGLGYSDKVVSALPYTAPSEVKPKSFLKRSPMLEYDFYTFNFGMADVWLQVVPTHPMYADRGVRLAVSIDDAKPVIVDFETHGRSEEWKQNVLRNAARVSASLPVAQAGKHTLKVWMVDPGVMLDQILVDLGGWKNSYAFPPQTINKDK